MFTGDSTPEQGLRVLAQIMDLCEDKPVTINQLDSHAYLSWRLGKREVGQRLVQWLNEIPMPPDDMIEDDDG